MGREQESSSSEVMKFFENRFGAHEGVLADILGSAMGRHIDDADLYFEYTTAQSLSMEEGMVKKGGSSSEIPGPGRIILMAKEARP